MTERKYNPDQWCDKPDRDNPKIKCGYPKPCPHHTVVIDKNTITYPVSLDVKAKNRKRISELAKALREKS